MLFLLHAMSYIITLNMLIVLFFEVLFASCTIFVGLNLFDIEKFSQVTGVLCVLFIIGTEELIND